MRCTPLLTAALVAVTLGGCVIAPPEDPAADVGPGSGAAGPMFSPTPTAGDQAVLASPTPAPAEPPSTAGDESADATTTASPRPSPEEQSPEPSPSPGPAAVDEGPWTGSIEDRVGDVAGRDAEDAPPWADLAGADILVGGDRSTIVLTLAGDVPETPGDGEFVSIGTFHDLTGDGYVDREVWAAGSADGWGTSYWDHDRDSVAFGAEDDVDLERVGREIRLTFPSSHLDDARTGRWQVTLEWVRDTLLSQRLAADDAPDDRNGATWGR